VKVKGKTGSSERVNRMGCLFYSWLVSSVTHFQDSTDLGNDQNYVGRRFQFPLYCISVSENYIDQEIEQALYGEDVVCPVCCRNCYNLKENVLECAECQVKLSCSAPLFQIRQCINSTLSCHGSCCVQQLVFTYIPDSGGAFSLMAVCMHCSFMNIITWFHFLKPTAALIKTCVASGTN